jgi:hypothetical protein
MNCFDRMDQMMKGNPLNEWVMLFNKMIVMFGSQYGFDQVRTLLQDIGETDEFWKSAKRLYKVGKDYVQ